MNEAEIEQNIIPWKNEASEQAMFAASRVEAGAIDTIQSATEEMTRGAAEERQFMTKAAGQSEEANRGWARDAAEKTQTMLASMANAQGGFQDLQTCMSGLVEGVVRTNLRLAQEMFLVRSPHAFVELQRRFLHEYFDAFQEGTAALIRATSQSRNAAA
jgi:hypothetical protein